MIREIQEGRGFKHETGVDCLKLDLTHLRAERIKEALAASAKLGLSSPALTSSMSL